MVGIRLEMLSMIFSTDDLSPERMKIHLIQDKSMQWNLPWRSKEIIGM